MFHLKLSVSSSCLPESLPKAQGNGLIYPKLYSYPDGYIIDFLCPLDSTADPFKYSKCTNGTFDVDYFRCVNESNYDSYLNLT